MITSNYLQKLGSLLQYKCFYEGTKYYKVGFCYTDATAANSHVYENNLLLLHAKGFVTLLIHSSTTEQMRWIFHLYILHLK